MISVCIPTYNGEKFLSEQLDSILMQISENDEIIISDAGSNDSTLKIIDTYNEPRIKVYHFTYDNKFDSYPFYKITKNIENAIVHAKGDLIFLADQDDVWEKTKIITSIEKIVDNLALIHDCRVVNRNLAELQPSYYSINKSKLGITYNLLNSSYLGCCMVLRKELFDIALPFPNYPVPHDIWFGLIADYKGKMKMIDDKLLKYRRHGNNISSSSEQSQNSLLYKFKYRINLIKALTLRLLFEKQK